MGLYAEFSFIDDGGMPSEVSGGDDQIGEASVFVDYTEACEAFVEEFLKIANKLVPVDTGYLRSTIDAGHWGDGFWCEATADYAEYVEYGTSNMDAQPYFEPALQMAFEIAAAMAGEAVGEAQDELEEILGEMLNTAMNIASGGGNMMTASTGQFIGGLALFAFMFFIMFPILVFIQNIMNMLDIKNDGNGNNGAYPEVIIT